MDVDKQVKRGGKRKPELPEGPARVRDLKGVAGLLGLELFEQRGKLAAQMSALRELVEMPWFPAKVKGYWPAEAVRSVAKEMVVIAKDRRAFKVEGSMKVQGGTDANLKSQPVENKPVPGELGSGFKLGSNRAHEPLGEVRDSEEQLGVKKGVEGAGAPGVLIGAAAQRRPTEEEVPAGGQLGLFDLDSKLARFAPQYQSRLRGLYLKWLSPMEFTLTKADKEELQRAGLIEVESEAPRSGLEEGDDLGAGASPAYRGGGQDCNSITEVAAVIAQVFRVDCRKQYVSDWRRGERLPTGVPVFPPPDPKSNRYKASEFLPWYERYILKRMNGDGVTRDLSMNLVEERDRAELEEIQHARFLRERELGNYVAVSAVEQYIEGMSGRETAEVDKLIEDRNGLRRVVREVLSEVLRVGAVGPGECGRPVVEMVGPVWPVWEEVEGNKLGQSGTSALPGNLVDLLDARLAVEFQRANDGLKDLFDRARRELEGQIEELRKPKI